MPPKRWPAKAKETAIAASGADAGAAVASRVTAPPRARTVTPMRVAGEAVEGATAEDGEADEDEGDEQPGVARGDQPANGERRPRRRGRRGGRRRRGAELEDGLAGSIADELGPTPASEVTSAVADFDGGASEPAPSLVQADVPPEPVSQPAEMQPAAYAQPEPVESAPAPSAEETSARGRAGRGAAAFDRARESQLRDQRSGRTGALRQPQRAGAGRVSRACSGRAGAGHIGRSRATQGGLVVAALRQRRVRIKPKRKPPGENRAVFYLHRAGSLARRERGLHVGRIDLLVQIGVQLS